ncbi:MAG: ribbon-helix-helix domain-containing protein [Acidobacteria bacterium]|nr:ribbon-helix-helix domain-containing protein [Acidobacteriota bacterium]
MHRTTVMLPQDLKARAMLAARERGISFGELLRECLTATLNKPTGGNRASDPLFADTAVYEGPAPSDLAQEHDRYLYDE